MSIYGSILEFVNKNKVNLSSFKVIDNPDKEFIKAHIKDAECVEDFLYNAVRKHATIFLDKKNNKIACCFVVFNDRGHYILSNFEVTPNYRGKGLSNDLLDYAVKKKHADHLWVNEDNKIAIHLYLKYGFKFTGDKAKEDGHIRLYMALEGK